MSSDLKPNSDEKTPLLGCRFANTSIEASSGHKKSVLSLLSSLPTVVGVDGLPVHDETIDDYEHNVPMSSTRSGRVYEQIDPNIR